MFRRKKDLYQKIIIFKEPAIEKRDLHSGYKTLLFAHGAFQVEPLPLINGALCFFEQPVDFDQLARLEEVLSVEDNLKVKLYPVFEKSKSLVFDQHQRQIVPWGVQRIGAPEAWPVSRGEGVKVGILDTGVDFSHPDLKVNFKGGINLLSPQSPPLDDNGHGTHVAGIIAAVDNGFGILGASPGVHLFAVKALNAAGEGYFSDVIRGLDWCMQNGPEIINLSFGSDQPSQALHAAVKKVVAAGKIIVAAAGNDGTYQSVDYPAAYPEVVAVGATDEFDQIPPFTSRGPELNLVAPGSNILSTTLKGFFKRQSGTSMAAPFVAGALAILKRLNGQAGFEEILKILQATAEKLPGYGRDEQGAGLVRVDRAISMLSRSERNQAPDRSRQSSFRRQRR
ncbi:MAG: S8 family peptidase [Bacillota bacterium]